MTNAHLFRVIVPVRDIDRAARFYRTLLASDGERVSPGRHYFDCQGTILACFDAVADGDETDHSEFRPNPDHLYLAVDDLDDAYRRAARAGCQTLEDTPRQRPWGERSFYGTDPSGNPICVVQRSTMFTGAAAPGTR